MNGVQNYLSNVFQPKYVYTGSNFNVKLTMSNLDVVSSDSVDVKKVTIADTASNVFMGSGSGGTGSENINSIGIGVNSLAEVNKTSNSVFLGNIAGTNVSNVSNTVAIGYDAASLIRNTSGNVIIGTSAGKNISLGNNNVFVGNLAGSNLTIASNNILIGPDVGNTFTSLSNRMLIGSGTKIAISADLSGDIYGNVSVGINNSNPNPRYNLDVNGYTYIGGTLGIGLNPREHVFSVNGDMFANDGFAIWRFDQFDDTRMSAVKHTLYNTSYNGDPVYIKGLQHVMEYSDVSSFFTTTLDTSVTVQLRSKVGSFLSNKTIRIDQSGIGIDISGNVSAKLDVSGDVRATSGVYSYQGTVQINSNQSKSLDVPLRKGAQMMIVFNASNQISHHVVYSLNGTTIIGSNVPINTANTSIGVSGGMITLSNANLDNTFNWNVTYFPTA